MAERLFSIKSSFSGMYLRALGLLSSVVGNNLPLPIQDGQNDQSRSITVDTSIIPSVPYVHTHLNLYMPVISPLHRATNHRQPTPLPSAPSPHFNLETLHLYTI